MVYVLQVVISGLYTIDNNQVHMFDRPVKSIALDPNFAKAGSGKHYMTGDDKVSAIQLLQ